MKAQERQEKMINQIIDGNKNDARPMYFYGTSPKGKFYARVHNKWIHLSKEEAEKKLSQKQTAGYVTNFNEIV
jgi:hypothetical protein